MRCTWRYRVKFSISFAGLVPERLQISVPLEYRTRNGMPRIQICFEPSGYRCVWIVADRTVDFSSVADLSKSGAILRHGPHEGIQ